MNVRYTQCSETFVGDNGPWKVEIGSGEVILVNEDGVKVFISSDSIEHENFNLVREVLEEDPTVLDPLEMSDTTNKVLFGFEKVGSSKPCSEILLTGIESSGFTGTLS